MSTFSKGGGGSGKIIGNDNQHAVDVELQSGKRRLLTDAIVTVEEIFGQDPFPDSFFTITAAGAIGDTIRVQVAATTGDTTTPDRDVPAVDETYTLVAGDVGDEIQLRDNLTTFLNGTAAFGNAFLKAQNVKDRAVVHVTSTKFSMPDEFYERPISGDFDVTTTGTTTVSLGFDNFISRGKATSLARDPSNPHRLGILGISGSVSVFPSGIEDRFESYLEDSGSNDMLVDGSSTPVVFEFQNPTADEVFFVTQIRIFGGGNGIKFGQFLSKSTSLTNGLLPEIRSKGFDTTLFALKTTEDFKNLFASSAMEFKIDVQAGEDQFIANLIPALPFPLDPNSTDFIKITVRDDITSGLSQLQSLVTGFGQEV